MSSKIRRSGEPFDELEGLALLADYGVPVIESVRVDTLEDVIAAAERIRFPVAVKTAAPGVQHKSDVSGVRLGIDDSPSLEDAYSDLERNLGPQVTVAPMVPHGVEVALGIVRDPQFGSLVLVGAGGVLVEVLKDRGLAMPPIDELRARSMVDRLKIRPLLDGVRGQPAGTSMRSRGRSSRCRGSHTISATISRRARRTPVICARKDASLLTLWSCLGRGS